MKRNTDGPTMIDGVALGPDGAGAVALLAPRGALSGPLLKHVRATLGRVIPWPEVPLWQWRQPPSLRVPHPERPVKRPPPTVPGGSEPRAWRDGHLSDGAPASTLPLATTEGYRSDWQWLHRLVDLSGLGWAFVVTAVLWELFAFAFTRSAGWGWDRGAFFFAWGLGILALGFFLRTSRRRTAVSRLFLGMNIFMVSVLSLVVATR